MITIIIDSLTPQNAAALLAVLDDASRGEEGLQEAFNAWDERATNADLEKLVEDQSRTITKLREENQRLRHFCEIHSSPVPWGNDPHA